MKNIAALLISALLWHAPVDAMVSATEVVERRQEIAQTMGDNAILVMFPEETRTRSNDVDWPYRQSNHLYYLTNQTLPGTHLIWVKDGGELSEYLFAKLSDPHYEVWQGRLPSLQHVQSSSGTETVYSEDIFSKSLGHLLNGRRIDPDKTAHFKPPEHFSLFHSIISQEVEVRLDLGRTRQLNNATPPSRAQKLAQQLREQFPELKIRDIAPQLEAMRRTKSKAELALLQKAIDITGEAHKVAMVRASKASHEYQVQASIEYTFRGQGACCWAFASIVAGGANGTILHYVENDAALNPQNLLLIDIGAELEYYAADITRTFPISGQFSPPQKAIYQLVLDAQAAAIKAAAPGKTMRELQTVAMRIMGSGLLKLGLISEDNDEQVMSYFLHSLGHSLGLDTHDAFEYHLALEPNMVVTVEPGIYVRADDIRKNPWYSELSDEKKLKVDTALKIYKGIGVRIEDVILTTRNASKTLSPDIPVSVNELESFMAENTAGK